jgi:Xaa-Pro aminopeptidase
VRHNCPVTTAPKATPRSKRPATAAPATGRAKPSVVATNNYDADLTPEFKALMKRDWAEPKAMTPKVAAVAAYAAARRARLSAAFPGEALVIPAGRQKSRSNDTYYPFRPHTAYTYLTGHQGEGGILVLTPKGKTGHNATLYVRPRNGRSTEAFYRDRDYGELWVGPRPDVADTAVTFDIACKPLAEFEKVVGKFAKWPVRRIRRVDGWVEQLVGVAGIKVGNSAERDAQLATAVSELRILKDEWEIAELQAAVDATKRGFEDVIAEFPAADSERWLEGTFFRRARTDGNYVGYGSIVACGEHACTLHWTDNDGAVRQGDLALLDMGVEGHNLYTADVTRTVPVNGRFTPRQRKVYQAVLDAQEAGIAATVAGASFLAPHVAAMRVLTERLLAWGLLDGTVDENVRLDLHRRYTLHGTSHMLGIDVHDCAAARNEYYRGGTLQPGMVLTVEPGLYFQPDDLTVPKSLRGIGVRIEDDIVVTDGAPLVLSNDIPKTVAGIEAWMASLQK